MCKNLPPTPRRIRIRDTTPGIGRIHIFRRRTSRRRPAVTRRLPNRCGRHICHNKNYHKDNACSAFARQDRNLTGYIPNHGKPGQCLSRNGHICRHSMARRRNKAAHRLRSYCRRKHIPWNKNYPSDRGCRRANPPDRDVCHTRLQYTVETGL